MGWFTNSVLEDVEESLDRLKIKATDFESEKQLEKLVFHHLGKDFNKVTQQYNLEGALGLRIDIDIDNEVGVELKLADGIKSAPQIHRLFGQAIYYQKRYQSDLIFLIVGDKISKKRTAMKEIIEFLEELGITVIYKAVK